MLNRRAIAAFYDTVRGRHFADSPGFDISLLHDALDQLAAMWIALTLGNEDRQQMMRDVELVMRTVRTALQQCEAIQASADVARTRH